MRFLLPCVRAQVGELLAPFAGSINVQNESRQSGGIEKEGRMTTEEFKKSPKADAFGVALQALWFDAHGDWEKAHQLAQAAASHEGDWVHAYLHRKEGDEGNASYWYSRAGKTKPKVSLDEEWEQIAKALLAQSER
ncbi:MAG TPA: hypothetical protein VFT72_13775 [Opitutaceae bacterium]|nr:hypothetical protein [Opitutaceae bacterium]